MFPFLWPLLGAALGGIKTAAVDVPRERREKQLAATTQRLNPWTKLQAKPVEYSDPFGNVLNSALSFQGLGQSIERSGLYNDLLRKQASGDNLNVFSPLVNNGVDDSISDIPLRFRR